jgi:hypothetical protein
MFHKPQTLIVPAYPFSKTDIDPHYQREAVAAERLGITVLRLNFEELTDNGSVEIYGKIHEADNPAFYRGWMISVEDYQILAEQLQDLGITLLTSPEQYQRGHTLPGWYPIMREFTPESWHGPDLSNATYPAIVKDYVKSAKHLWDEACYIPNKESHDQVTQAFLDHRDTDIQGEIVLRKFIPDLTGREIRSWWINGELMLLTPHPDNPEDEVVEVPTEVIENAMQALDLSCASVDFAERENGEWIVIEVGDGGVSDLAETIDAEVFYKLLLN